MRPRKVVKIVDPPEQRTVPGTPKDRDHRMDAGTRVRYGVVLVIVGLGIFFAQKSYVTAREASRTSHEASRTSHEASATAREVARLARRVGDDEHHQAANRITNVTTWCHAINGLQTILVRYVAHYPGTPPLALHPLDCRGIEQRTLSSTRSHTR